VVVVVVVWEQRRKKMMMRRNNFGIAAVAKDRNSIMQYQTITNACIHA
jgi:hypothetical protein